MTIQKATVHTLFNEALSELIHCYSEVPPDVWTVSSATGDGLLGARIKLNSGPAKCRVVLLATEDSVRSLVGGTMIDCRDWLRELANQLAGRFKNKATALGLPISVTIPQSLIGSEVAGYGRPTEELIEARWQGQSVFAVFHADDRMFAEGQYEATAFTEAAATEGSVCLF